MPKLPAVTGKEIVSALCKKNFIITGQKGSHVKLRHRISRQRVIVPCHAGKIIPPKTLKSILEDAGLNVEEFKKLL